MRRVIGVVASLAKHAGQVVDRCEFSGMWFEVRDGQHHTRVGRRMRLAVDSPALGEYAEPPTLALVAAALRGSAPLSPSTPETAASRPGSECLFSGQNRHTGVSPIPSDLHHIRRPPMPGHTPHGPHTGGVVGFDPWAIRSASNARCDA